MNDTDHVWKMMHDLDFCMLVTGAGDQRRSRPMSSIIRQSTGDIFFLTERTTSKDDEIAANPEVLLCYANGSSQFVSTNGRARIIDDRELVRSLWNPGAQAFWPSGPEDADIVVIAVRPTQAEYWDGPNMIVGGARMLVAAVTGSKPDMGENKRVSF